MSSSDSSSSSDSDLEELVSRAYSKISSKLKNNALTRTTRHKPQKNETKHNTVKVDIVSNEIIETDAMFVIDKQRATSNFITANDPEQFSPVRENDSDIKLVVNSEEIDKAERLKEDTTDKKNKTDKKKHKSEKHKNFQLTSSIQSSLSINDTYLKTVPNTSKQSRLETVISGSSSDNAILKKSVLTPDIERKDSIPAYEETLKQKRFQKRKDRTMTKGKNWFDMKAPEMTEEQRNDLMVLKMRRALDPKRFYKSNDIKALPMFFQFGRVVESPADFYHSRIPKKQRKATMVEELLADAEFRKYNKRKYEEIQEARMNKKGPYQRTFTMSKKKPTKDNAFKKKNRKIKKSK